ncbi:MAG TPA: FAD binding domain-containing protein [Candidatus Tectomicrobia bacterium]|nr:FAD binding domain-containing protein [Candidatus Tectomicrobia bacterium]
MRPFAYTNPETVEEAIVLLGQNGHDREWGMRPLAGVQPLAGGTDLLTLMKADVAAPAHLVNLKRLTELPSGIEDTSEGLRLGALATLADIETHAVIQQRYPLLAQAAAVAATPQLRNMATLGGNLLQRPRCWYFRSRLLPCWLKGGGECPAQNGENQFHALFGGGPCYAVHPSDLAPALLTLDAQVRLQGPAGIRMLPLAEFFSLPKEDRRHETEIGRDELLLSVLLPPLPTDTQTVYLKAMDRKVWAFALVAVAAALRLDGQRVADARLVLGGVAPIPWRASAAEHELLGAELSATLVARAAEAALAEAAALGHNAYKVPLAKALIRRALTTLTRDGAARV